MARQPSLGAALGAASATAPSPRSSGKPTGGGASRTGGGFTAPGLSGSMSRKAVQDRDSSAAVTGINTRMEQLAAAMEVRLQAQEAQMMRLASDLSSERSKSTALEAHVAELSAKATKANEEIERLREDLADKGREAEQMRQELRWVDEAAAKARALEEAERREADKGLHAQVTALADAHARHTAESDSTARGASDAVTQTQKMLAEGLARSEARLAEIEAAAGDSIAEVRAAVAEAAAAREAEVVELAEAQSAAAQKLSDELRWVDEEHMRCRTEDDVKVTAALDAVREETSAAISEVKAQVAEAIVPLGEPGALTTLQQALMRVDTLGEAVAQLCAYMQSLKIKEVASAAEARLADLEERMSDRGGSSGLAALEARLAALEVALQQEQQSSLKALQAILESAQQSAQ